MEEASCCFSYDTGVRNCLGLLFSLQYAALNDILSLKIKPKLFHNENMNYREHVTGTKM